MLYGMKRSSAPRRDFAAMQEERRRRAARLFAAGKYSQAEIALPTVKLAQNRSTPQNSR
jgi:hypothetical protein